MHPPRRANRARRTRNWGSYERWVRRQARLEGEREGSIMRRWLLIAVFSLFGGGAFAQQPDAAALHDELRALRQRVLDAVNKGDIDSLVKELSPAIRFTSMNNELVSGLDQARDYEQRIFGGSNALLQKMMPPLGQVRRSPRRRTPRAAAPVRSPDAPPCNHRYRARSSPADGRFRRGRAGWRAASGRQRRNPAA